MINLYPSWFTFIITNLIGLIIVTSSTNWFFIWIGLELSLFGFIPLFLPNKASIESITNYLLIQAGGSTLFLISYLASSTLSPTLLLVSIIVNLGLFPFFQWVPSIIAAINWTGCLILSTIQNVGPLLVLFNTNYSQFFLLLISGASILISGIIGINQNFIRPLLGYSSISHTAWIASSLTLSQQLPLIYIIVYFLTNTILILLFSHNNTNNVISNNNNTSHPNTINFLIFNLLGLPPFSMFFLNISVLQLIFPNFSFILLPMILGSILSAYFYLTFVIPSIINNYSLNQNNIILITTLAIVNLPIVIIL